MINQSQVVMLIGPEACFYKLKNDIEGRAFSASQTDESRTKFTVKTVACGSLQYT